MSNTAPVHGQWGYQPNGIIIHTRIIPRILGFDPSKSSLAGVSQYASPEVSLPVLRNAGGEPFETAGIYSAEHSQYFGGQLRESSGYCIENNQLVISGKTTMKVQVGFWIEGRVRYNAPSRAFLEYDQHKSLWGDDGEIMSHDANGNLTGGMGYTLLTEGRVCNIQDASAVLKTFWIVTTKPNSSKVEGLALGSPNWSAISNGNGTIRWQKS
jgi:hypothetical protein